MSFEKRIYRVQLYMRVMTFLGVILFGFLSIASYFDDAKSVSMSCFVPFWLMSLVAFISSLYKVEVTDMDISVTNYLRTKTLRWDEIASIIPKNDGYGFYITNQGTDTKLLISNQVVGFLEIAQWFKYKRPDLLKRETPSVFHQVLLPIFVFGGFGLIITIFTVYTLVESTKDLWSKLFLLVFGLSTLGLLLFLPKEIAFEGKNLVIKYFGRVKIIQASDVSGISIEHRMSQNISVYPIQVQLKNGKKLTFGNIREGSQALMSALEQWLQAYKPSSE